MLAADRKSGPIISKSVSTESLLSVSSSVENKESLTGQKSGSVQIDISEYVLIKLHCIIMLLLHRFTHCTISLQERLVMRALAMDSPRKERSNGHGRNSTKYSNYTNVDEDDHID